MSTGAGSIVWLASFPSSGNTWLRIFLINLLRGGAAPADINSLVEIGHAADRSWIDECVGVESSELSAAEVENLRPLVYEAVAIERSAPYFIKIHDACGRTPGGRWLVPAIATRCAIYVVRNPLDVAVSYAHHRAAPVDETIDIMSRENHTLEPADRGALPMLPQRVGGWSTHVKTWVDQPEIDVHVVRYEDMKARPENTFGDIARAAGLQPDPAHVRRALEFSDFAELRRQEERSRFRQGSLRASRFFRQGEVGAWRDRLSSVQAQRIADAHGETMRRFGYLQGVSASEDAPLSGSGREQRPGFMR